MWRRRRALCHPMPGVCGCLVALHCGTSPLVSRTTAGVAGPSLTKYAIPCAPGWQPLLGSLSRGLHCCSLPLHAGPTPSWRGSHRRWGHPAGRLLVRLSVEATGSAGLLLCWSPGSRTALQPRVPKSLILACGGDTSPRGKRRFDVPRANHKAYVHRQCAAISEVLQRFPQRDDGVHNVGPWRRCVGRAPATASYVKTLPQRENGIRHNRTPMLYN